MRNCVAQALSAGILSVVFFLASTFTAVDAIAGIDSSQTMRLHGSAWSPALGAWLPKVGGGFDSWNRGLTSLSTVKDAFVCGATDAAPMPSTRRFTYASAGCQLLLNGTYFVYGSAGPTKGHVVYDRLHNRALYQEGCCSWGSAVLASDIRPPPKPVHAADLIAVHTARGVWLGMTPSAVMRVYGRATEHGVPKAPDVLMLSYTTLNLSPSNSGNKCGQFENFAFRSGRLVYIELMSGC